jgi:hypothetical protein
MHVKEYRIELRDQLIGLAAEGDFDKQCALLDTAEKMDKESNPSDELDKIISNVASEAVAIKKRNKKKKNKKKDSFKNRLIFTFMFLYQCYNYDETREKLEYHNYKVNLESVKRYGRDVVNAIIDYVQNNDQLKEKISKINVVKTADAEKNE